MEPERNFILLPYFTRGVVCIFDGVQTEEKFFYFYFFKFAERKLCGEHLRHKPL